MLTRRDFGLHMLACGSLLCSGGKLWARTEIDLGQATLTTLSDGHLTLPESFLYGDLDRGEVDRILASAESVEDGLAPPCNLTLLRSGDVVALFDAGSGSNFMPSAGKLTDAMAAAGFSSEEITHVIFTHGHPDHLWGVLDDFDEPVFMEARHMMGAVEHAYWSDPRTVETISTNRQSFAAGAARRLDTLGDALETFEDGETLVPGVTAIATPGHTPGHMSFEISFGNSRAFVVGDAIGNAHVALARPGWHAPADQDPETGARTRKALLDRLVEDQTPAVGFHLPDGGLGRFIRDGDAYAWSPG